MENEKRIEDMTIEELRHEVAETRAAQVTIPERKMIKRTSCWVENLAVTVELWYEVMGTEVPAGELDKLHHPKVNISFYDVVEFMNRRSERDGYDPVYVWVGEGDDRRLLMDPFANGYRLPTDAEYMEFATGPQGQDPWHEPVEEAAHFNADGTSPVGQYLDNDGVYDATGNTWTMCVM